MLWFSVAGYSPEQVAFQMWLEIEQVWEQHWGQLAFW
jgi:hypothetical protein